MYRLQLHNFIMRLQVACSCCLSGLLLLSWQQVLPLLQGAQAHPHTAAVQLCSSQLRLEWLWPAQHTQVKVTSNKAGYGSNQGTMDSYVVVC